MATGLVEIMKIAAMDAYQAGKPMTIMYADVTAVDPLEITINPSITLKEADGQIKLARQVTDYDTSISLIDPADDGDTVWRTEEKGGGSGEVSYESHYHDITGKHRITVHNKLKVGEKVILVRMQGGKEYLVIDRVGE